MFFKFKVLMWRLAITLQNQQLDALRQNDKIPTDQKLFDKVFNRLLASTANEKTLFNRMILDDQLLLNDFWKKKLQKKNAFIMHDQEKGALSSRLRAI